MSETPAVREFTPRRRDPRLVYGTVAVVWLVVAAIMKDYILNGDWQSIGYGAGILVPITVLVVIVVRLQASVRAIVTDKSVTFISGHIVRTIPFERITALERRALRPGAPDTLHVHMAVLAGGTEEKLFYENSYVGEDELARLIADGSGVGWTARD